MNYKTSQFNIVVPVENSNELILFNTKECSFVVLDEKTQGFLEDINELNTYKDDIVKNLVELGFIIEDNLDEIRLLKEKTKKALFENKQLSITIVTTSDCNMNCYYCYVDKKRKYLNIDKADKIINLIITQLTEGQFEKILISWTGGEPLLNENIIEYISKPIIEFCNNNNIEYHGSIVTNGLLLKESQAKLLKEIKVRDAQVTIDGLENTHNKRRISLDGYNSFRVILDNVSIAYDYMNINIRINVDTDNQKEIKELLDYLYYTRGYKDNDKVSVDLAKVNGGNSPISAEDYHSFFREIYDDYILTNKIEQKYPTALNFACGAQCNDSYVIGPEGYIYRCWEEVGIEQNVIGTLEKIDHDCESYHRYLTDYWPEKCGECSYLPLCHGGCPKRKLENNNQPICEPKTKVLDKFLRKYYDYWQRESEVS